MSHSRLLFGSCSPWNRTASSDLHLSSSCVKLTVVSYEFSLVKLLWVVCRGLRPPSLVHQRSSECIKGARPSKLDIPSSPPSTISTTLYTMASINVELGGFYTFVHSFPFGATTNLQYGCRYTSWASVNDDGTMPKFSVTINEADSTIQGSGADKPGTVSVGKPCYLGPSSDVMFHTLVCYRRRSDWQRGPLHQAVLQQQWKRCLEVCRQASRPQRKCVRVLRWLGPGLSTERPMGPLWCRCSRTAET